MTPVFTHQQIENSIEFYNSNGFVAINSTLNDAYLDQLKSIMLELIEIEKNAINAENYRDYH